MGRFLIVTLLLLMFSVLTSCTETEDIKFVERDRAEYFINKLELSVLYLEFWGLAPQKSSEAHESQILTELKKNVEDIAALGQNLHPADLEKISELFLRIQLGARKLGKKNIDELMSKYEITGN
ncbi:MAG: hypothetical protein HBSAPP04_19820 [Ignavibacteriaceae bacterium]|nr:MAG: hypothetical protein HBSAPP04_19820 [Ignavibacteriaceae bacterium]